MQQIIPFIATIALLGPVCASSQENSPQYGTDPTNGWDWSWYNGKEPMEIVLEEETDQNVFIEDPNPEYGINELHKAAWDNDLDTLNAVLSSKNAPMYINALDEFGNAPLHLAIVRGHDTFANILISNNADLDLQDKADNSPLHLAIMKKRYDIITRLVEEGCEINLLNGRYQTPTELAESLGETKAANFLRCRQQKNEDSCPSL